MNDIFISTLTDRLPNWSEAFPAAFIFADLPKVNAKKVLKKDLETTFWLHMNEDRQQWMAKTIATILSEYKNAKIVVLVNVPNHAESLHALSLGARGYCHAFAAPSVL